MIQTINISLIPSDNKPVINVSQYDNGLRVLRFNIFDDTLMEVPHVFDSETVTCNIRKNDNNIVVITGTIETETTEEGETSYVQVVLTEQACACVGSNYGEISLSVDNAVIGTCNFKLIVERSPLAGGVESATAIDNLTTQIETITEQVIGENYYTKTETDNLLNDKADADDIYTKTETDNLLNEKADTDNVYTKTETDNLLNEKADTDDVYTKIETDNKIAAIIDDDATVSNKTWSSEKISDEIYAILPVGTVSGAIASFNTALTKPLVSCVVDENATKLYQRGVNLWDEVTELGSLNTNTGAKISSTANSRSKNKINLPSNTKFSFVKPSGYQMFVLFYDVNDSCLQYVPGTGDTTAYNSAAQFSSSATLRTFTTPENTSYALIRMDGITTYESNISLNYPATNTNYQSYNTNSTEYNLPVSDMPITFSGNNNFFTDYGDTTVQYKDTIQNYIDTRINTVSNRSLSLIRNSNDALSDAVSDIDIERGETDER